MIGPLLIAGILLARILPLVLPLILIRIAALLILRPLPLLHLAPSLLHRRTVLARLFAVLVLLVAVEHADDLAPQVLVGARVARASLRMRLRILVDEGLDALLLVPGEVEAAEPFHPAMLEFGPARRRPILRLRARRWPLLGRSTDRYRERHEQSARRY